ncbi:hypothetical protein EMPS_08844 [Entomortierella parvispora]|uniref:Uncharacterized protein n=1 Tax=Entomortierella parvispora TaxID=205924 RepID=A0A9P3HGU5_9FUNG|nr:hypothetical protein EMPS_08844 [Entomortierella parvispora]
MDYTSWANDEMKANSKYISFKSFVRKFGFISKEVAMSHYSQMLESSRLAKALRESLRSEYDVFVEAHLDSFWLEWDRELASDELTASCDTVAKRTAAFAQRASLALSARGFSKLEADNAVQNGAQQADVDNFQTGRKHPRDPSDNECTAQQMTPRNKLSIPGLNDPFLDDAVGECPVEDNRSVAVDNVVDDAVEADEDTFDNAVNNAVQDLNIGHSFIPQVDTDEDGGEIVQNAAGGSASSSTKRPRSPSVTTVEPWHTLAVALVAMVNGATNAPLPSATPAMSESHSHLFHHTIELLQKYQGQTPSERDILLIKDAQVSMSCLLNTISSSATTYFDQNNRQLLHDARQMSHMPNFTEHPSSSILREYCEFLEAEGVAALRSKVICDRGKLQGEATDYKLSPQAVIRDKTLHILEKLCDFILHPPFPKDDPSESDCLHLWASIFVVIMEKIHMKTGETVLAASKIMKRLQFLEHGDVSEAGRKVDCIFLAGGVEVSNIEFKRLNICGADVAIQNRKNVRLARCIQEEMYALGLENPVVFMADVQGYTGAFYRICPMGDIAIAGTTTDEFAHIPTTEGGLIEFLEDSSLPIIWNYIVALEANVRTIETTKEKNEARMAKVNMKANLYRANTPPPHERAFRSHVMLTPTKSKKRKSEKAMDMSKPKPYPL